jgi:hypothetical protein
MPIREAGGIGSSPACRTYQNSLCLSTEFIDERLPVYRRENRRVLRRVIFFVVIFRRHRRAGNAACRLTLRGQSTATVYNFPTALSSPVYPRHCLHSRCLYNVFEAGRIGWKLGTRLCCLPAFESRVQGIQFSSSTSPRPQVKSLLLWKYQGHMEGGELCLTRGVGTEVWTYFEI